MSRFYVGHDAIHTQDDQCTIDPETGHCRECGVDHGDPCGDCGGRGFHRENCPTSALVGTWGNPRLTIELRNLHLDEAMSDERLCFKADMWVNGEHKGSATSRGDSGATSYHWEDQSEGADIAALAIRQPSTPGLLGDEPRDFFPDLDVTIGLLAADQFLYEQMQKKLADGSCTYFRLVSDPEGEWQRIDEPWSPEMKRDLESRFKQHLEAIANHRFAEPPKAILRWIPPWMGPTPTHPHRKIELTEVTQGNRKLSAAIRVDGEILGMVWKIPVTDDSATFRYQWELDDDGLTAEAGQVFRAGGVTSGLDAIVSDLFAAHEAYMQMIHAMDRHPGVWWRLRTDDRGWWRVSKASWDRTTRLAMLHRLPDLEAIGNDLQPPVAYVRRRTDDA